MGKEFDSVKDSGQRQEFDTGAVRDTQFGKGRYDLVLSLGHMLFRLARHFENGAVKYGDDNWKKGIPLRRYLDSAFRHLTKYADGGNDEDHLTAAIWNLMCHGETKHMIESGVLPVSLDDMPICEQDDEVERVYMSHSIRGKKGKKATKSDMAANNIIAIEAAEKLRKLLPGLSVYVPAENDEFVAIAYLNGDLDEKTILDIDCEIVERCDSLIIYSTDGYLSRGMVIEIRYALNSGILIQWFTGDVINSVTTFAYLYPEEWEKTR